MNEEDKHRQPQQPSSSTSSSVTVESNNNNDNGNQVVVVDVDVDTKTINSSKEAIEDEEEELLLKQICNNNNNNIDDENVNYTDKNENHQQQQQNQINLAPPLSTPSTPSIDHVPPSLSPPPPFDAENGDAIEEAENSLYGSIVQKINDADADAVAASTLDADAAAEEEDADTDALVFICDIHQQCLNNLLVTDSSEQFLLENLQSIFNNGLIGGVGSGSGSGRPGGSGRNDAPTIIIAPSNFQLIPKSQNEDKNPDGGAAVHNQHYDNQGQDFQVETAPPTAPTSGRQRRKLKRLEKLKQKRREQQQEFQNGGNRIAKPRRRIYWQALPMDILENIFKYLSIKDRHLASQVCPHWFECFYSPTIWTTLFLDDYSFTKRKFNYYLGYQKMICPFKTQMYLQRFGHNIRNLIIKPMHNFFNLYEFMKILTQFSKYSSNNNNHNQSNQLRNLKRFEFEFGCHWSDSNTTTPVVAQISTNQNGSGSGQMGGANEQQDLIGTGGKLLEALKELLLELIGLKHLSLKNLLLNQFEAKNLLDNVLINCLESLKTLTLINCSRNSYPFLHTGVFINLEILIISRQHLDENVLQLLAQNLQLQHIYLVQNEVTPIISSSSSGSGSGRSLQPIPRQIWHRNFLKIQQNNCKLHLVLLNKLNWICNNLESSRIMNELILEPTRITSIIFDAPILSPKIFGNFLKITDYYSDSLESLEWYGLPKFKLQKSFQKRIDSELIYLSEKCQNLRTLIINDLISTCTLLLIVKNLRRNLTKLLIRRNSIRKRFDFYQNSSILILNNYNNFNKKNPEYLDETFLKWLKFTSKSYDETFKEISRMLGYQWQPLSDEQFKKLQPNVKF